jgi:hypothetical protein
MSKYYAGIGSRETPVHIQKYMADVGAALAEAGYTLRSGGALGADTAFEIGAHNTGGFAEIFKPNGCTPEAEMMAASYHPNWPACSPWARKLHGRNCHIVLGRYVHQPIPVEFIICWTHDARTVGGTGQALRMADALDIEVLNLGSSDPGKVAMVKERINQLIVG